MSHRTTRIKLLDVRLANQIAAGEVVERPASVVKELLENSIDSGASRIELDVERGGTRLIRVTDNGAGIEKDDLKLALTRHATSKIATTEDLAAIRSLGFRGEALASISSVSRLSLTSRPAENEIAWQAIAQGRDMQVEVLPAAAAPGTRIEVADLFYNTPARQKFLRTEKTEFAHVEEVFKQHALANFSLAFVLKHNHRVVKRVPASSEQSQKITRVASICGKGFADNCVALDCQHELMAIHGWLGLASYHRSESDIQYVFVNGRPVKDKTLNHAIRQAYEGLLPAGRMATFVIFIEMDPARLDVNVHPTKHEVRFDQQRLVHDLLAKSVSDCLMENEVSRSLPLAETPINDNPFQLSAATEKHHYQTNDNASSALVAEPTVSQSSSPPASSTSASWKPFRSTLPRAATRSPDQGTSGRVTTETDDRFISPSVAQHQSTPLIYAGDNLWLYQSDAQARLFSASSLFEEFLHQLLLGNFESPAKALLFPQSMLISETLLEDYATHQLLNRLGFVFQATGDTSVKIERIPFWLTGYETSLVLSFLSEWLESFDPENKLSEFNVQVIYDKVELSTDLQREIFHLTYPHFGENFGQLIAAESLHGLVQ